MKERRTNSRLEHFVLRISAGALFAALMIGCATTGRNANSSLPEATAMDSGAGWRKIEGLPNAYVPADLPLYESYNYENGGWVDAQGMAFFIPHGLSKEENDALIESFLGPISTWEIVTDASLKISQILVAIPLSIGY